LFFLIVYFVEFDDDFGLNNLARVEAVAYPLILGD
jgi:hypothetical protein